MIEFDPEWLVLCVNREAYERMVEECPWNGYAVAVLAQYREQERAYAKAQEGP